MWKIVEAVEAEIVENFLVSYWIRYLVASVLLRPQNVQWIAAAMRSTSGWFMLASDQLAELLPSTIQFGCLVWNIAFRVIHMNCSEF